MIRQIIVPTSNSYVLNLPDELVGKEVEVLAFELQKEYAGKTNEKLIDREGLVDNAIRFFKSVSVDTSHVEKYSREDLYE